jgi:hypothetical protein
MRIMLKNEATYFDSTVASFTYYTELSKNIKSHFTRFRETKTYIFIKKFYKEFVDYIFSHNLVLYCTHATVVSNYLHNVLYSSRFS